MRRMRHVRGISAGRAGDVVQADVRGDHLEIRCAADGAKAASWLCRIPAASVIGFDCLPECGAEATARQLVRLFGRKGQVAQSASPDGQWTLDLHIQRDGKFAKVTLAGERSEAEGLMYDVTAARGSASPSFGVAL